MKNGVEEIVNNDPDGQGYMPPIINYGLCPLDPFSLACPDMWATAKIPQSGTKSIVYEFSLLEAVVRNPVLKKVRVYTSPATSVVDVVVANHDTPTYYHGEIPITGGGTFNIGVQYLGDNDTVLATCGNLKTLNFPVPTINSLLSVLCEPYVGPYPNGPGGPGSSQRHLRYHRLRFEFGAALTEALTLDVAFFVGIAPGGFAEPGYTNGYGLLPDGTPEKSLTGANTVGTYDLPYRINIPSGVTQFTTDSLEFGTTTMSGGPFTQVVPCRDNVNMFPYTREKVWAKIVNNTSNKVLNITSIGNQNGYPTTFEQIP